MTFEDFKIRMRKETIFEKYWYYGLSIAVFIMSLYILFGLITRLDKFGWDHVFLYIIALFLLLLSASGFYLLPNRYKIVTLNSYLTIEQKQSVLKKLLDDYTDYRDFNEQHYISFTLRRGFWKIPYKIHLFFDEVRFAFSIQVQDYIDGGYGGYIDFGGAERKRKEIANKILELSIGE